MGKFDRLTKKIKVKEKGVRWLLSHCFGWRDWGKV